MNQLRLDADTANGKVEELQAKIKALEQESLSKEQEITSLQHKNGVLEGQVEKLEGDVDKHKKLADEGSGSLTQNEALQRRLQLLEEEAEEADKTLREANEKYVHHLPAHRLFPSKHRTRLLLRSNRSWLKTSQRNLTIFPADFDRPTSRLGTLSARCRPSRTSVTSGRPSTRRCQRSTARPRRRSRISSGRSVPSDLASTHGDPPRACKYCRRHGKGRVSVVPGEVCQSSRREAIAGMGEISIMSARINASVNELLGFIARQAAFL